MLTPINVCASWDVLRNAHFYQLYHFWRCLVNLSTEKLHLAKSLISIFFPDGQDATETVSK